MLSIGKQTATICIILKNVVLMFFRLFANAEIPFGEPSLLLVSLHHHHPVQLFDRYGDIQAKIHRATLRTVSVQSQLLNGYVVFL